MIALIVADARTDILVTGTGSLSTAILHGLTRFDCGPLRLSVLSRDTSRLTWVMRSVAACAASARVALRIEASHTDWRDHDALCRLVAQRRPRVVLHTASLQSPWSLNRQDAWSQLVRTAGYGVTLPLQILLARKLGQAIGSAGTDSLFVNACYPDAVNPMLHAAGVPVLCGVGNVAILAALMSADLGVPSASIQVIAHHSHVAAAISGVRESMSSLKAWRDGESIDDEAMRWLRGAHFPADERLNVVTAASASQLALCLLGRSDPLCTNAPGPYGRPGGYPVYVQRKSLLMRLPSDVTEADAIQCNETAAANDGVTIDAQGIARFSDQAAGAIKAVLNPELAALAEPFAANDAEARASLLMTLRSRLSPPRE